MDRSGLEIRKVVVMTLVLVASGSLAFAGSQGKSDGFDDTLGVLGGACCAPGAMPDLPLPPGVIELPSVFTCIEDCAPHETWVGYTLFEAFPGSAAPLQNPAAPCDEAFFRLRNFMQHEALVLDPCNTGEVIPFFDIDLRAKYAETVTIDDDANPETVRQVWRWLVHGNAVYHALGVPCPQPAGVLYPPNQNLPFDKPPFTGHVDLSRITIGEKLVRWEVALVLTHSNGCITHGFNFLLNGLALDPATDPNGATVRAIADRHHYHLVAPCHECAPYFDFVNAPPAQADVAMGGQNGIVGTWRTTDSIGNSQCYFENDAVFDATPFGSTVCLCGQGGPSSPKPWYHETVCCPASFKNGVYCGSSFYPWEALPTGTGPSNLPTGFTQVFVGRWLPGTRAYNSPTAPLATWLNKTAVLHNFGVFAFTPPCWNGPAQVFDYQVTHGVTTFADTPNIATFVDVPTIFHTDKATLLLQMVNTVARNEHTFMPGPVFVAQDRPYMAASLPLVTTMVVGAASSLGLPDTAGTMTWSFGR